MALTHVELPDGHWADLKDTDDLTNRERKLLRRAIVPAFGVKPKLDALGVKENDPTTWEQAAVGLDADDLDLLDDFQGAYIVAYVGAWSLGPLPTLATVDDIPGPIYDALSTLTVNRGDGTVDLTADGATDPKVPTAD
jgi:hypothetical protein